jgi:8-oxo-dGTP pyrophosphatase MutT (NUDIX family)
MTQLREKDFGSPPDFDSPPCTDGTSHEDPTPVPQNGALCWRLHRGRIQILLVTSRDTGRWVIPKGWPMPARSPAEVAAIEAWEEAGVRGEMSADPLGLFDYDKTRAAQPALPCTVSVHALRVTAVATKFPERKQRRRKWFDAHKAAAKVAEPQLRALLSRLVAQGKTLTLHSKAEPVA